MEYPDVYALLVTGKDEKRSLYARVIGLKTFNNQTYEKKHMIIINHGTKPVMVYPQKNVYELMVDKGNMSLGDLRNLSLELVPMNAVFYIHDDDDYRPNNYIQYMIDHLLQTKSIAVFLKNRLEYNLANGFTFKSSFDNGNTHIMCIKIDRLRYLDKNTLEDVELQKDIKSFKKKYHAIDNDPKMYLRIIHQNNTSPHVSDERKSIVKYSDKSYYKEYEVTKDEKEYVDKIIKEFYGIFLYKK